MNEAGMPIEEALYLATYVNAALLDMGNQLGQIKAGFLADIVATDQKADEEITTLTQVSFVMKNGEVIKQ
jgi:imidazolonepropionase-like amidohydrolase